MTDKGSPGTGESATTGTVVQYDKAKHTANLRGDAWEVIRYNDITMMPALVVELTSGGGDDSGRIFTSEELEALPEFLRDGLEPEPVTAPTSEPKTAQHRPARGVPRKLIYGEALAAGRPDLTDKELILLFAMWKYADNTTLGDVFPGHTALAEAVGLSGKSGREKVRTRIGSLARKGYVVKTQEGRTVPRRQAAVYRLTLPEWEEPSS